MADNAVDRHALYDRIAGLSKEGRVALNQD